jgi:hypothetical protein
MGQLIVSISSRDKLGSRGLNFLFVKGNLGEAASWKNCLSRFLRTVVLERGSARAASYLKRFGEFPKDT